MLRRSVRTIRLWQTRIAACLSALWIALGCPVALAAPLVPICGKHAETLAAPPISRPAHGAVLRKAPCSKQGPLELQRGLPERAPERVAVAEPPPLTLPTAFPLAPAARKRTPLKAMRSGERDGFRPGIERPPR